MSESTKNPRAFCYMSTPEHIRSFKGRFVYIYTDKGELSLTEDSLLVTGKSGVPVEMPFTSIKKVSIGSYSRIAKPVTLNYIELNYQDAERAHTILLTPTISLLTPVWETNKTVFQWAQLISSAAKLEGGVGTAKSSKSSLMIVLFLIAFISIFALILFPWEPTKPEDRKELRQCLSHYPYGLISFEVPDNMRSDFQKAVDMAKQQSPYYDGKADINVVGFILTNKFGWQSTDIKEVSDYIMP